MMAFSACIGFGLFQHTAKSSTLRAQGSPSLPSCSRRVCSGEMTALFPIQGPLFEFPARYLDDAVGYAVGWMAWFSWAVTISSQALAVAARTIIYFNFGT
ncbi:hypothetical protein DPSP01_012610 [Paraphaeosphaeria sporulosa]